MPNPPIFLLGEARGANEAAIQKGFVGSSGVELLRMLDTAKIITLTSADKEYISRWYKERDPHLLDCVWQLHPEVHRSNVFQQHPWGNDLEMFCGPKSEAIPGYPILQKSKYVRAEFQYELDRLSDELVTINPNIIICLGNTALWAMAGRTGISKHRGTTSLSTHTASGFKLLPTYHPAGILRQWENRPVAIADLIKAEEQSHFPDLRRVRRLAHIPETVQDVKDFLDEHGHEGARLSVDIETSGSRITSIGFAPNSTTAITIPFDDDRKKSGSYWDTREDELAVVGIIARVLRDPTIRKTYQNGLYDLAFVLRAWGIPTFGADEDTMLLHHALQPESLKGLGFLGSIYCDEGAWKQERGKIKTIKRDS